MLLFLGAFPPPCLLLPLCPIPPLPSSSPPPDITRPVPTTAETPLPPASDRPAHRSPESFAWQYTARPYSDSSWRMSQSPGSLLQPLPPPRRGIPNSHPPSPWLPPYEPLREPLLKTTQGPIHPGGQYPRLRPEQQHRLSHCLEKYPDTPVSASSRLNIRDKRPRLFLALWRLHTTAGQSSSPNVITRPI